MQNKNEEELMCECRIADAAGMVAEDYGFFIAILVGVIAYQEWHSWLISIAIGSGVYFLAVRRYHKQSDTAWAAYRNYTVVDAGEAG